MLEELRGCVTCLSWTYNSQECSLKELKNPETGVASVRCKESEGTEICGRAHHQMLHGSNSKCADADLGWGTPREPGEFRPNLFAGRPVGSILKANTEVSVFEIVKAPAKHQNCHL